MTQRTILILGSGGLRIGQAGEFDYSGSQAIKALKEEGCRTILVNPNIATVQTDASMADRVYLQPLNLETVTAIIAKERPDAIILSMGGQTALNLGLDLHNHGVLEKYGVEVLGSPIKTIEVSEDRELFKRALTEIGVSVAKSRSATTLEAALTAAEEIGYPLIIRAAWSLGGQGSGVVKNREQLERRVKEALSGSPQVLLEESLEGWKEIEYEIVRDSADNTITVCNMENFDPMGIHTGESIVVAPSQTLTNQEYHSLREVALKTARHLGIIGECNIQYALNSATGEYRVIEVNPRLSRSSALASKATGYPLAFVAAKILLGKLLPDIPNGITGSTSAFFEPALDYLVVKMPRWDLGKFEEVDHAIGTEMKSVGEVMAIGRSFPEALQKAVRMLHQGTYGLQNHPYRFADLEKEMQTPTDRRIFALSEFFKAGGTVERAHTLTAIDPWFLSQLARITEGEKQLAHPLTAEHLRAAKELGFSDETIAVHQKTTPEAIRRQRLDYHILPVVKQIDTLAGEYAATTNYLYLTYHGQESDITASPKPPYAVIGSGPYSIGSSVEFDWSAVTCVKTLRALGHSVLIINSNPETVSTDFDQCDRLYFEEITEERVRDILDFEQALATVVSFGGQVANNLAIPLNQAGYALLGTKAEDIDHAENRHHFSQLLTDLNVDQPAWEEVTTLHRAQAFAERVGYPILVRPSYVLSGAAMRVIYGESELETYLEQATLVSRDHPVVISKFILNAKELEIDGVAKDGKIVIEAISEHIENAGIHSGDATVVLPPQNLYLETIRRAKRISRQLAAALHITGPFNIQFIATNNELKVIECNLRGSRSFPFVSKVTNHNFVEIATRVMLGEPIMGPFETLELDYVGVKSPQFSYNRLKGVDPVAHVEMASTGEVACLGDDLYEAFLLSWLATGNSVAGKRLLVSVAEEDKPKLLDELVQLHESGWELFATPGTAAFLEEHEVSVTPVGKLHEATNLERLDEFIRNRQVDLVVNIPGQSEKAQRQRTEGYEIRRLATAYHVPLVTNLQIAKVLLFALSRERGEQEVQSWQEYINK